MCSNTSSSGGCGCGTGGGNGGIWSSGLKKQQKRPRVPKRGPGVAELEKILREQEKKDKADRGNAEGFSFIPHHSNPYNPQPLKSHPQPPPSPPPPKPPPPPSLSPPFISMTSRRMPITSSASSSLSSPVPLAQKFDPLGPTTPPMTALYGNNGFKTALGRNVGGSAGSVLPEQAFFPMNLSSCKSSIDQGVDGSQSDSGNSSSKNLSSESNPPWPYPALLQRRHNQCPAPSMNQFQGSNTPSSPSSLPRGLINRVEPPSSQSSYYNYTSKAPEEHKVVGMKRPHPSSLDNSLIPPNHFQCPPTFSHFSRLHQSSTNESHSANSFTSATDCYRDSKSGSPLDLNGRKFYSNNGRPSAHANFPSFGTPTVPSPPMNMFQGEFSKANVLPYPVTEDRVEDCYQRSESCGSDHKPFYSFLKVKEQEGMKETTLGSMHEGSEARNNVIDLSLKL